MARLYAKSNHPVWMPHGVRGEFAKFDGLALGPPANWSIDRFDTGAMPQFETPGTFADRFEAFLKHLPGP